MNFSLTNLFQLMLIRTYIMFIFSSLAGSVLIFVTKKANSEELAAKLKTKDFEGTFTGVFLRLLLTFSWEKIVLMNTRLRGQCSVAVRDCCVGFLVKQSVSFEYQQITRALDKMLAGRTVMD